MTEQNDDLRKQHEQWLKDQEFYQQEPVAEPNATTETQNGTNGTGTDHIADTGKMVSTTELPEDFPHQKQLDLIDGKFYPRDECAYHCPQCLNEKWQKLYTQAIQRIKELESQLAGKEKANG